MEISVGMGKDNFTLRKAQRSERRLRQTLLIPGGTRPPSALTGQRLCGLDSKCAFGEQAIELGGAIDAPQREWHFDGATVCDGYDPEGNILQLREPGKEGQ